MKSEGIYRVSGFTEHIEDVKMAFDRGMYIFISQSALNALLSCLYPEFIGITSGLIVQLVKEKAVFLPFIIYQLALIIYHLY